MSTRTAEAKLRIRIEKRLLRSELRDANRRINEFGRNAKSSLKNTFTGGMLGIAGAMTVSGKSALDLNKQVWHLGRQAKLSNAEIDKLPALFREISDATGVGAEKAFEIAKEYMDLTGALEDSLTYAEFLAKAVASQNAPAKSLAVLMDTLRNVLKLSDKEARAMLNTFIEIGNTGSVPLEKMAATLPEIVAGIQAISGETQQEAARLASAVLQTLQKTTSAPEKSLTAAKAAMAALGDNAKKLKDKYNIEVFDSKGSRRALLDILSDLAKLDDLKNNKNNKLREMLGSTDATIAVKALLTNLQTLKNFAGVKAEDTIGQDFAKYMDSSVGKMAVAAQRAKNAWEAQFTPERIAQIAEATEHIASAIGLVADNWKIAAIAYGGYKAISMAQLLRDLRFSRQATRLLGLEAKKTRSRMNVLGGVSGPLAGGLPKAGKDIGRIKRLVGGLGRAVPLVGAAFAAWELGGFVKDLMSANEQIVRFKRHAADELDPTGLIAAEANKAMAATEKLRMLQRELRDAQAELGLRESGAVPSDEHSKNVQVN